MGDLLQRIIDEVRTSGPITFARYMERALYDPDEGFFANPPVGPDSHFITSPHLSLVFADAIAEQVRDTHHVLGGASIDYVELGAGDGTLARAVMERAGDVIGRAVAVEWSTAARAKIEAPITAVATVAEAGPFRGLVVANELLDNIPFHRFRRTTDGKVVEVFVGEEEGVLVEVAASPSFPVVVPIDAREWVVAPAMEQVVVDLARAHAAGHVLFIDYGWVEGEPIEPVRGYRGQRMVEDLLEAPGSNDITGPVDFDALTRLVSRAGYLARRPVTQRDALYALGYRRAVARLRNEQVAAEAAGLHRKAIELFGARNEAAMLVTEGGLGSLKVLCLSTEGVAAPKASGSAPGA